jgi:hypothetical protein
MQPSLARLAMIMHGRDQHVARIADEMEDPDVVAVEQIGMAAEVGIVVEEHERRLERFRKVVALGPIVDVGGP